MDDKEDVGLLRKKLSLALAKYKDKTVLVKAEEFEKDNDQNQHIDFIWAMANIRSSNYKLEPMDWMTVKIKAGRIIPALATTTAAIAGLQTIELVKLLNNVELQHTKNAFLNLAIPYCQLTEPGPVPKVTLQPGLTSTIWDRWELSLKKESITTLDQFFQFLHTTYSLSPMDVFMGSVPLYINALYSGNERQLMMDKSILALIDPDQEDSFVDLTVTFSKEGDSQVIAGVPVVRVFLA